MYESFPASVTLGSSVSAFSLCEPNVEAVLLSCAAGVYTALGFSFLQGLKSVQRVFSELTESNLTCGTIMPVYS